MQCLRWQWAKVMAGMEEADTAEAGTVAEVDMRAAVTAAEDTPGAGTSGAQRMSVEDMWEAGASEADTLAARIPESVTAGCIQVVFLIQAALVLLCLARS